MAGATDSTQVKSNKPSWQCNACGPCLESLNPTPCCLRVHSLDRYEPPEFCLQPPCSVYVQNTRRRSRVEDEVERFTLSGHIDFQPKKTVTILERNFRDNSAIRLQRGKKADGHEKSV